MLDDAKEEHSHLLLRLFGEAAIRIPGLSNPEAAIAGVAFVFETLDQSPDELTEFISILLFDYLGKRHMLTSMPDSATAN